MPPPTTGASRSRRRGLDAARSGTRRRPVRVRRRPYDQWEADPFKAVERDGRLVARGVADDKADVMARIHAVEVLKHLGEIPVTLRFLVEGEEEIGSKTFEKIAHKHADKLKADGCLWESGGFDSADRPMIFFV